jgi:metal-dependent HD superfamily phosphatase/phosphodiesterase
MIEITQRAGQMQHSIIFYKDTPVAVRVATFDSGPSEVADAVSLDLKEGRARSPIKDLAIQLYE